MIFNKCYTTSLLYDKIVRDITKNGKGWVLHALYCAFYGWYHLEKYGSYSNIIDTIIKLGGDTDLGLVTVCNAAITGALLGAQLGYNNLLKEEKTNYNISVVLNINTEDGVYSRLKEYTLYDFINIVDLFSLISFKKYNNINNT